MYLLDEPLAISSELGMRSLKEQVLSRREMPGREEDIVEVLSLLA